MRRPAAIVVAVLALLLPAAPAVAQSNPFTPPQPAVPTAAPTPAPTTQGGAGDTGTSMLYAIGAGLLVVFVGIGIWIARDARRSVPQHHRGHRNVAEPAPGEPRPRKKDPRAKQRSRQKARAQRRARRHNR